VSWSFIDILFLVTLLLLAVIPKKKKLWIIIIGSHGIGSFSFELRDDLPSQKSPIELRASIAQTGANDEN
jgi:hypothetical protein